jgi:hypothetical protein
MRSQVEAALGRLSIFPDGAYADISLGPGDALVVIEHAHGAALRLEYDDLDSLASRWNYRRASPLVKIAPPRTPSRTHTARPYTDEQPASQG